MHLGMRYDIIILVREILVKRTLGGRSVRKYFRSFFIGFAIGMCFFAFLFIYTYNFYKNSNSIFFINSNYNTYLSGTVN